MGNIDDQQKRILERLVHRVIRKMSKNPIERLKDYAQEASSKAHQIEVFKDIFDLHKVNVNIPKKRIMVGSRSSKLALAQTNLVLDMLRKQFPDYEFAVKPISTGGDHGQWDNIGAFVKEVEVALLNKEVDVAIHSYKDLPMKLPEGLTIAGVPRRGDVRDALVSRNNLRIEELPAGSRIGTSSMRRKSQIENKYPNLEVVEIHGNIITRMDKIKRGDVDAVIIAAAGLERINSLHLASQIFELDDIIPAVAQGVLAVEVRKESTSLIEMISQINHFETQLAVRAERAVLNELGGGCKLPLGAYAKIDGEEMELTGCFASSDLKQLVFQNVSGHISQAEDIGRQLASKLSRVNEAGAHGD